MRLAVEGEDKLQEDLEVWSKGTLNAGSAFKKVGPLIGRRTCRKAGSMPSSVISFSSLSPATLCCLQPSIPFHAPCSLQFLSALSACYFSAYAKIISHMTEELH